MLVVDDEIEVLKNTSRMLSQASQSPVFEAVSGEQALEIWRNHRHEIRLLVSDIVMPGLSGDELAAALLCEDPSLQVLFISGNDPFMLDTCLPLSPGRNFLQKPFTARDIHEILKVMRVLPDEGA